MNVLVPIYRGYFNIPEEIIQLIKQAEFSSPFIEDTSIFLHPSLNVALIKFVLVPIYRGYFNITVSAYEIESKSGVFSSPFIEDTSILKDFEEEYNALV